jgi:pyridoxine 5-phosphate synthase
MAATDEMVTIAIALRPQLSMFVPERRAEVTTEGGLDVAGQEGRIREAVARLKAAGIAVSAFIDADERQVAAAARAGFDFCEIHTGPYAHAHHDFGVGDARTAAELTKVRRAVEAVVAAGMRPNAGHALNYANVGAVAAIPNLRELHIGHAIVSRAVFAGLRTAVAEMKAAMVATARG